MKFYEFEELMSSKGFNSLADMARALNTTPQAVSNWKARNQVPYHIVAKISQESNVEIKKDASESYTINTVADEQSNISLSDLLIVFGEQLKVIFLIPFIFVFITFTYTKFIQEPLYQSTSTILLPKSNSIGSGGLAGIASQFGVNVPQTLDNDLSSPALFPEILASRTFARRILNKKFYSSKFDKKISLLSIYMNSDKIQNVNNEKEIQHGINLFRNRVMLQNQGAFSVLISKAKDPELSQSINKTVLDELQVLNRFYKIQHVNEKTKFIKNRIESVERELEKSEKKLKIFRQKNRQISSPALQLDLDRLNRDVEVQKGVYLTLKQQLELAKIEEIQESSILQILDEPQIPLSPFNKKIKLNIIFSVVTGLGLGIFLGFIRSYFNNNNIDERKKLRKFRSYFNKKRRDLVIDRRITGIVSLLFICGLPFYIGHKSANPEYFGLYSSKYIIIIVIYILSLTLSLYLFINKTVRKNP